MFPARQRLSVRDLHLALALAAGAVALFVAWPASALAAIAPEVFTNEARTTGAMTEEVSGEINPEGEATEYHLAYGLKSSLWCEEEGALGSPEKSTSPQILPSGTSFRSVTVEVSGLTAGKGYCAELVANNGTGETHGEQVTFTAGLPAAFTFFEPLATGAGTETIEGEVDPYEQTTTYEVAYGLSTSEWCTSFGSSGSPTNTTVPQTLPFTDKAFHVVTVDLSALTPGKGYCAEVVAKNPSGEAKGGHVTFTAGIPGVSPSVGATPTGKSTETIEGQVNPVAQSTEYHVADALSTALWCTSSGSAGSPENSSAAKTLPFVDLALHPVTVELSGLVGGKAYCAALVANNTSGSAKSHQTTFTAGIPEVFAFETPTGASTEKVEGEVNPLGQTTKYDVSYALSTNLWCTSDGREGTPETTTATQTLPFTDAAFHPVSVELTGLTPGKAYCAALIATNESGTAQSRGAFTSGVPEVFTGEPTPTGASTETIVGEVDPVGQSTEYHVAYGLSSSTWCTSFGVSGTPESSTTPQALPFTDAAYHAVTVGLSGLTGDKEYCAELIAKNASGEKPGGQVFFTTGVPGVIALEPQATGATSEAIVGEVDPVGQTTTYEVAYGPATSPWCEEEGREGKPEHTTPAQTLLFTDATYHPVSVEVSGLTAGHAYCAVVVAKNASGPTTGERVTFTAGAPGVFTTEATPTGATSEAIGGEVAPFGQSTKYQVDYGLATSRWCTSGGFVGESEHMTALQELPFVDAAYHGVSVGLSGLTAGKAYCAQLLATNKGGTTRGAQVSFTAGVPAVATGEARAIGASTAEVPGTIDPAGQSTEYHVAYGLSSSKWCTSGGFTGEPEQTTSSQALPYTDDVTHAVAVALGGLTAGTAYCAELVGTNATATTHGGQVGFTTASGGAPPAEGPSVSTSTGTTVKPPAPTGAASLAAATVSVTSNGRQASIKISCKGTATCTGKLTLTVKITTKKDKKKHTKTVAIGAAGFSVPAGKTVTVKLNLSSTGSASLKTAHGHLTASLTILKTSPSPSAKQTATVHLVQQKPKKHKK